MKKLAVLYIATGKYVLFWENFFRSAESNLLPNVEKEYFVFSDAEQLTGENSGRVHLLFQEPLEWPYPTLYRFRFFLSIEEELQQFDYIYFFNANIRVVQKVNESDFLPNHPSQLVVTKHPYFWNKKSNTQFTYERNPQSRAYVPEGEGELYAAGGLNGGTAATYLSFVHACNEMTEADLTRGIIARWHDESYLNRYIIGKRPKVLHPGYLYPAETTIPFERVLHLERKEEFLRGYGKYAASGEKKNKWSRFFGRFFRRTP